MQLGHLTWRELTGDSAPALDAPLVLVPVGSLEQHGPHLPLATDTLIATAIAERSARALPGAVVAPALPITASGEHTGFPGTLSIGTDATAMVVVELARSADWAEGVVFVNGHGGNHEAISRATATLRDEGRRILAWWPRVDGGDAHAGQTETSLVLAISPHLVRAGHAERGNTDSLEVLATRLRAQGVRAVSANGVLGDPTGASAADGERLLESLVADLVAAVEAWRPS